MARNRRHRRRRGGSKGRKRISGFSFRKPSKKDIMSELIEIGIDGLGALGGVAVQSSNILPWPEDKTVGEAPEKGIPWNKLKGLKAVGVGYLTRKMVKDQRVRDAARIAMGVGAGNVIASLLPADTKAKLGIQGVGEMPLQACGDDDPFNNVSSSEESPLQGAEDSPLQEDVDEYAEDVY